MKSISPVWHYLITAALAAGAFFLGYTVKNSDPGRGASQPEAAASPILPANTPVRKTADRTFSLGEEEAYSPADRAARELPLSTAEVERSLRNGLVSQDPIERGLLISLAYSGVTRENATDLLAVMESTAWRSFAEFKSVFGRFMLAWGRVDGPAAVAYQQSRTMTIWRAHDLAENAFRGWAESDPEAAIAYLDENPMSNKLEEKYFTKILEGLLTADMETAFSLTAGSEPGKLRGKRIDVIGEALQFDQKGLLEWADHAVNSPNPDRSYMVSVLGEVTQRSTDGRAVAEWMDRHPQCPYTRYQVEKVVELWAQTDPRAALQWVNNSPDERVNGRQTSVMKSWSETDPEAVLAWTTANPNHPKLKSVLPYVVEGLARSDLQAAVDWTKRLDTELVNPQFAGNILNPWVRQAPDDALQWIESLPDDEVQGWALYSAAKHWPQDRINEFETWLNAEGTGERLDRARGRLSYRFVNDDPVRAIEIARGITDEQEWERAANRAVQSLMKKEPETLRLWADQLANPR